MLKIVPYLWYEKDASQAGKAKEVMNLYTRLLPGSTVDQTLHYGPDGPRRDDVVRKAVVLVINNGLFLLSYVAFGGILAIWK